MRINMRDMMKINKLSQNLIIKFRWKTLKNKNMKLNNLNLNRKNKNNLNNYTLNNAEIKTILKFPMKLLEN